MSMLKNIKLEDYPTVKEWMETLDADIRTDIGKYQFKYQVCYCIGNPAEPGAGLRAEEFTPWFFSMNQLERFCKSEEGKALLAEHNET